MEAGHVEGALEALAAAVEVEMAMPYGLPPNWRAPQGPRWRLRSGCIRGGVTIGVSNWCMGVYGPIYIYIYIYNIIYITHIYIYICK
jgi:hypothetical protein